MSLSHQLSATDLSLGYGAREIVSGLDPSAQVVAAGGSFLGDADLVRVVAEVPLAENHSASSPGTAPLFSK